MDRKETITRIKELINEIKDVNEKQNKWLDLTNQLDDKNNSPLERLKEFDKEHRWDYVHEKTGDVPKKPSGWLKPVFPVYLVKNKEYKKQLDEYLKSQDEAEKMYYSEYAEERERLEIEDLKEKSKELDRIRNEREDAYKKYKEANDILEQNDLVGEKHKNIDTLEELLGYLQEERAESLKEAINLYHEEQHRKKLEDFAEEQLRLTKEAKELAQQARDYAEKAAQEAADANFSAEEAVEKVEAIEDRIDDAFSKAEEAYDKAEEAYDLANSSDFE